MEGFQLFDFLLRTLQTLNCRNFPADSEQTLFVVSKFLLNREQRPRARTRWQRLEKVARIIEIVLVRARLNGKATKLHVRVVST